jgi:hypothetical protein
MQHDLIDCCILNGFIYDEAARISDGMRSGVAFGKIVGASQSDDRDDG